MRLMPVAPAHFRRDIQAMRTFAVTMVVVYHLWPRVLPGGFIGVDIFFVISGFLITGNLLRESERSGRIHLWRFWSGRAKRLLPAALTVLASVTVAVFLWVPQTLWPQFLREIIGSTLYVENWVLARDSIDYLAAGNAPSPVQHFWTLSVEEQFYIAIPLLLAVVMVVAPRARRRGPLLATLVIVTLVSFGYSVWFTSIDRASSYFVTTTRAWEFAAGALLAFAPVVRRSAWTTAVFLAGAATALACAVIIDGNWPYPSWFALGPVLATVGMLVGGATLAAPVRRVVEVAPVQFVGRVSYSVYLWHWPLIVLLPYITLSPLTGGQKVAIIPATLLLAWMSTTFLEDPVRTSPRLLGGGRSPWVVMAFSAAGMGLVVAVAATGSSRYTSGVAGASAAAEQLLIDHPECFGAVVAMHPDGCAEQIRVLAPHPTKAATDDYNRAACWASSDGPNLHLCSVGPEDSKVHLFVVGDSHSNMLLAAYEKIAVERGWRIDIAGHSGCYWTEATLPHPVKSQTAACTQWRHHVDEHLADHAPYDAIVVTNDRRGAIPLASRDLDRWDAAANGMIDAWSPQLARGATIVAVKDFPALQSDVSACVAVHGGSSNSKCSSTVEEAMGGRDALMEAARRVGARVVDLTDLFCTAGRCVPIVGHVVAYRDHAHLTGTFARTMSDVLGDRLATAIGVTP
jgi:peptidoglycan/LPS O-acetylase OafA/YrhL